MSFGALLLSWLLFALMQDQVVEDVVFEGQTRVGKELLEAQLRTKVGSAFSWKNADLDSKYIYEKFRVVASCRLETLDSGGVRVVFELSELGAIRQVEFQGNKGLSDAELNEALGLSRRGILSQGLVGRGPMFWLIGRLQERYEEEGYLYAEIEAEVEQRGSQLVLLFRILEGPKVRVGEIRFEGLHTFKPGHLEDLMETKASFLFLRRTFKRKALDRDLARLEEFLRDEGFLDAKIALESLRPSPDHRKITVVLRVAQGKRYTIGEIRIEGNQAFEDDELRPLIQQKSGAPIRKVLYGKDRARILKHYGQRGYIRASLPEDPQLAYHLNDYKVDIIFAIREGRPKRIRDVLIRGNDGTIDEVIRRELFFYPGEVFDIDELNYSEDRLRASRLFLGPDQLPQVFVTTEETEDPDYEDVVIDVEEGETGFMNFLAGVGSGTGVFFGVSIDKENFDFKDLPSGPIAFFPEFFDQRAFHGAGQRLRLRANPGSRFGNFLVQFTEPYLTGPVEKPVSLDLTGFFRESILRLYDEDRTGLTVSLGKAITRDSGVSLGVRQERIKIDDAEPDVPDIISQGGSHSTRGIIVSGFYRQLDSLRNPTDGFRVNTDFEALGGAFGADVDVLKARIWGEYFYPLYENDEGQRHLLEIQGATGWQREYADTDEVPFFERFRAGGITRPFSMRGFEFWGVGPHQSGEPVGGSGAVFISSNYVFPIHETFDPRLREHVPVLRGIVFVDQGMLEEDWENLPSGKWRVSAGVGIRFRIPIAILSAPLELYYGVPIVRDTEDERESFTINFSTRF